MKTKVKFGLGMTKKNKSHHRRRKRKSFGHKKKTPSPATSKKKIIRKHCEPNETNFAAKKTKKHR